MLPDGRPRLGRPLGSGFRTVLSHVRFGSLADILTSPRHVRFTPKSGHSSAHFALAFREIVATAGARHFRRCDVHMIAQLASAQCIASHYAALVGKQGDAFRAWEAAVKIVNTLSRSLGKRDNYWGVRLSVVPYRLKHRSRNGKIPRMELLSRGGRRPDAQQPSTGPLKPGTGPLQRWFSWLRGQ